MFSSLLQSNAQFNSPVTAISRDPLTGKMQISVGSTTQEYSAVISTVPLPRLSLMDLTGVDINNSYGQWSAIRELQYGAAIKVWGQVQLPVVADGTFVPDFRRTELHRSTIAHDVSCCPRSCDYRQFLIKPRHGDAVCTLRMARGRE